MLLSQRMAARAVWTSALEEVTVLRRRASSRRAAVAGDRWSGLPIHPAEDRIEQALGGRVPRFGLDVYGDEKHAGALTRVVRHGDAGVPGNAAGVEPDPVPAGPDLLLDAEAVADAGRAGGHR